MLKTLVTRELVWRSQWDRGCMRNCSMYMRQKAHTVWHRSPIQCSNSWSLLPCYCEGTSVYCCLGHQWTKASDNTKDTGEQKLWVGCSCHKAGSGCRTDKPVMGIISLLASGRLDHPLKDYRAGGHNSLSTQHHHQVPWQAPQGRGHRVSPGSLCFPSRCVYCWSNQSNRS